MLKLILSIVGGLAAAFLIVFATDALFHALTSATPAPKDMQDREAMRAYLIGIPVGILATMVAGWSVAAFAGSAIAARFGGRGQWPGWVVTGLFFLATSLNFVLAPHPVWMVVSAIALILAAGWFGSRVGARTLARPLSEPV